MVPAKQHIVIPSLVRRCMKAYALKALIRDEKAELNRVGRSRNWTLTASFEQLTQIIDAIERSNEDSWLWVAKLLKQQYAHLTHDALLIIAKLNKGITVSELVNKTNCTIADARKVIDELEWADED